MIKRSYLRALHLRPVAVLAAAAALTLTGPASAQDAKAGTSASKPEGGYSTIDLSLFAGYSWFQFGQGTTNAVHTFNPAFDWGFRANEDPHKYFGLEEGLQIGYNALHLQPFGTNTTTAFSEDNMLMYGAALWHFAPRQAKYRPYVLIGPGYIWYRPSGSFQTGYPATTSGETALIYGLGLKMNETKRLAVRFDLRGMRTGTPRFSIPGIPSGPGAFWISPASQHESALIASVGITWRLRYHEPPPPPKPQPKVEPPAPKANVRITSVSGGGAAVCPAVDVRLTVNATGWLPDQTPAYQWSVNGAPVSGATSSSFNVPTDTAGTKSVTVRVSAGDSSATSDSVSVTVKPLTPPTIRFAVNPSTIPYGNTVPLAAQAQGSDCGGPATVRYSGEGVTGSTFDSKALSFDMSNRLRQQSRTVHLTATATDQKNQTASAGADVTVTLQTVATRLDDIVFPNMSSRVNNCAKRVLLEQLTPMLRNDPQAKVILIGHRDAAERGRVGSKLDETRVVNAAAVLSAGTGICPSLDLSRILWKAAGTDQSSATRPALCGSSTDVKEKGGQAVRGTDTKAQFRRVEIWIVPGGADMPAGIDGLQAVPEKDVKAKGCPK